MAFCGFLKQSTAATIVLGPFVDSGDGVTAETSLTISQSDVRLSKNGGAAAQKHETSAATHDEGGMYRCPVDADDTDTLGLLTARVGESGALVIRQDYMVVPANFFDSVVSGTDLLQVDVDQVDGDSDAAEYLKTAQGLLEIGTVTNTGFSPTTTEFETDDITTATADHWIGRRVYFTSGTLAKQGSKITDYALSSGRGHFTVETLTSAPANGVAFVII